MIFAGKPIFLYSLIVLMMLGVAGCSGHNGMNTNPEEIENKKVTISDLPVVTYENHEIYVNGKYIATAEQMRVDRLDDRVISLTTDQGCINLNADGENIDLRDVITDRIGYELTVKAKMYQQLAMRDSVSHIDYDSVLEVLSSYDKAMEQRFSLGTGGVSIACPDSSGHYAGVTYEYESPIMNPFYRPDDTISCFSWMIGRLGYGIPELFFEGYSDHWVENSLRISNYNGKTYIWMCVAYKDEEGNKTYYSIVADENKDPESQKTERRMVYSEKVDGPFVCCDLREFARIVPE